MLRTIATVLATILATIPATLLTVGLSPQPAQAQTLEELAQRGAQLFQEGQFREAAIVLRQAYDVEPIPVLLYNIGRAYQQDGRCFMASDYFTRYLASGDTQAVTQANEHEPGETACANQYNELMASADTALNGGQLDRAERLLREALGLSDEPRARVMLQETLFHLGRCDESRDYIQTVVDEPDLSDAQRSDLRRGLSRAEDCVRSRECTVARADCERRNQELLDTAVDPGSQQRTIAYIVGGVGAAVLVGAIIHDAVSQGTIEDYENAALRGDRDAFNDLRSDIDSAKTLSWILYGVGGAALITGVVLFFTASSSAEVPGLQNCTDVCWDFGIGSPIGHTGVWVGATF